MFSVDRLLKTELRGCKGDLKRPFDRSWKDYQEKYAELERQKKKTAKEAGEREREGANFICISRLKELTNSPRSDELSPAISLKMSPPLPSDGRTDGQNPLI